MDETGKPGGAENALHPINWFYFLMATGRLACYTQLMSFGCLKNSQIKKISLLQVLIMLHLTIWPAHYHLHHPSTDISHAHEHKHVVDVHVYTADMNTHHEDAQVFKASPDGLLKNPVFKVFPLLFLAILLAVIAITVFRLISTYRTADFIPTYSHYHRVPPLRGPPLLS